MVTSSKVDEVDFILVSNKSLNPNEAADRKCFEAGLKYKGLLVDHVENENQIFTKLRLPDNIKYKYFEILELRMPLKMVRRFMNCNKKCERRGGKNPAHCFRREIKRVTEYSVLTISVAK